MKHVKNWMVVAGVALALPVTAAAQQPQQTPEEKRTVGTTGAVAAAGVEEIVDNPERYYGEKVTVSGPVGKVFGPRVFNIEEEGVIDVDDELLVLGTKDGPTITDESKVQVRGTVKRLVRAELEREFGPTYWTYWGVDQNFFIDYESRPVLFAEAIDVRTTDR